MIKVYYWQAADRIVAVSHGRIIDLLSEDYKYMGIGCYLFTVEKTRSRMPKTLVYLGEL
jgi:hypothetical protein